MEENQIVIYKDENNAIQLDVKLKDGMIWVTRQQLATLFARDYKTISKHINNALRGELADEVVVANFANTTQHGAIEGKTHRLSSFVFRDYNRAFVLEHQRRLHFGGYFRQNASYLIGFGTQNH